MPYRAELKRPDLKGEFRCSLCQKIFCHSSSLSRHRMQAHFKCYTCTFCDQPIATTLAMETKVGKKPYKELNLAEKVSLIRLAEAQPALSQAELARRFGVAKSNVCRVLKRREEYVRVLLTHAYPGARKRKLKEHPLPNPAKGHAPGRPRGFGPSPHPPKGHGLAGDCRKLWPQDSLGAQRDLSGTSASSGACHGKLPSLANHPPKAWPKDGLGRRQDSTGPRVARADSTSQPARRDSELGRLLSRPSRCGGPGGGPALKGLLALLARAAPRDENNNASGGRSPNFGNETLRAHMLKQHQITRMFMCRCCNWAFPDKTSLHIHMQAMASGSPGNVSVIAKSSTDAEPGAALLQEAAIAAQEALAMAEAGDEGDEQLPMDEEQPPERDEDAAFAQAAWMANNFPQVDASGVGSLGGNLCLEEEEEGPDDALPVHQHRQHHDEAAGVAMGGGAEEERADSGYDEAERMDDAAEVRPSPLNSLLYQAKQRTGPGGRRGLDSIFPAGFGAAAAEVPSFLKRSESPSNTSASSCHPSPPNEASASNGAGTGSSGSGGLGGSSSAAECLNCRVLKGRLGFTENRNKFLEGKVSSLETKVGRLETRVVASDAAAKRLEGDSKALRDNNDRLHHQLIKAQEKALRFMQKGLGDSEATNAFLNDLLNATYLGPTD